MTTALAIAARTLADKAVQALVDEATLTPKPGLVDERGSGAHTTWTWTCCSPPPRACTTDSQRWPRPPSASEPRAPRCAASWPASGGPPRPGCSRSPAESTPTAARSGHWACSPAQRALGAPTPADRRAIASHPDPAAPAAGAQPRHLGPLALRGGGAVTEAVDGFPHARLAYTTLLRDARPGATETQARLDALMAVVASLEDTCLLHRGGRAGLALPGAGPAGCCAPAAPRPGRAALGSPHWTPCSPDAAAVARRQRRPARRRPLPGLPQLALAFDRRDRGAIMEQTTHTFPAEPLRSPAAPTSASSARATSKYSSNPPTVASRSTCAPASTGSAPGRRSWSASSPAPTLAAKVQINDFGATPGTVVLRLPQAVEPRNEHA